MTAVTFTPSPARFRVAVRRNPYGGFYWLLKRWDGSLARALGESAGWTHVSGGSAPTRPEAHRQAHRFAKDWIWREDNPEEVIDEFEIERPPITVGDAE